MVAGNPQQEERRIRNVMKGCVACGAPRHEYGRFCGRCNMRFVRTGNPYCSRVPSKREFARERHHAKLITAEALKQGHKGFKWAVGFLGERLAGEEAVYTLNQPFANFRVVTPYLHLWRELGEDGLTPEAALSELLAVWLYYAQHLRTREDLPGLKHMLAIALFRVRRGTLARKAARKRLHMGAFLYRLFRPLFDNVVREYTEAVKKRREVREAMEQRIDLAGLVLD